MWDCVGGSVGEGVGTDEGVADFRVVGPACQDVDQHRLGLRQLALATGPQRVRAFVSPPDIKKYTPVPVPTNKTTAMARRCHRHRGAGLGSGGK